MKSGFFCDFFCVFSRKDGAEGENMSPFMLFSLFWGCKYPEAAEQTCAQGRVIVSFIVECDGSITNVHVLHSIAQELDREAENVVSSMPRWIPGKHNGVAVRVRYNVPVSFRLN